MIYLDYSATTPVNEEVINTVLLSSLNEDEKNRMDNIIKELTERYMVVMTDG